MLSSRDAKIVQLWLEKYPNPRTRYCYHIDSKRLLNHAKKPLACITLADLQRFAQHLGSLGLAPISLARSLAAVKSLFGFCHRLRYLPANPAAELMLPCYEHRLAERILSEEDVHRMLAAEMDSRNRILLRLLYAAGLRVTEACHLRWRNLHVRGTAGQITVFGKNSRTRAVALPPGLWAELSGSRGAAVADELVFRSRTGQSLDRGRVRMIVRRAAQRAGITSDVSPHWLRHAHASHALDHGAPIHLVQATLGHGSVVSTSRYLHARPGDSSARFLTLEKIPVESRGIDLQAFPTRAMNVLTAAIPATGDYKMMTSTTKESETGTSETAEPKTSKKTRVGIRRTHVAPAKGHSGKKAPSAKKTPKSPKNAEKPAARQGSKTAKILDLLKRPGGATQKELMKTTGWQAHSVRGFISGTIGRKMNLTVESTKGEGGERSYSIVG